MSTAGRGAERSYLRIVGTDLLGAEFSRGIHAFAARENLPLRVTFDGTQPALPALRSGAADLGLLFVPNEAVDSCAQLLSAPIGYQPILILVPANCPLREITREQLIGIFAERGAQAVTRGSDLGLRDEWAGKWQPTVPVASLAVTGDLFRRLMIGGGALRSQVSRYESMEELRTLMTGTTKVIALAPTCPPGIARALAFRAGTKTAPVEPSADALHDGRYTLRLPLRLATRHQIRDGTREFIRWLLSEDGATRLRDAGVVPLPDEARLAASAAFESEPARLARAAGK